MYYLFVHIYYDYKCCKFFAIKIFHLIIVNTLQVRTSLQAESFESVFVGAKI